FAILFVVREVLGFSPTGRSPGIGVVYSAMAILLVFPMFGVRRRMLLQSDGSRRKYVAVLTALAIAGFASVPLAILWLGPTTGGRIGGTSMTLLVVCMHLSGAKIIEQAP